MKSITQIDTRTFKTRLCRHTNGYKEQLVVTFRLDGEYTPEVAQRKAIQEREKLAERYRNNLINPLSYSEIVENVYHKFIDSYRMIHSPETADFYFNVIKNDIIPIVKDKPISSIDQSDLEAFVNRLIRNDPKERTHSTINKGLSGATIRRYETCFCEFMHWCEKKKYTRQYPFDRAEVEKPKAIKPIVRHYTREEYKELYNIILDSEEITIQDKILMCLDGLLGLRRGEIVALSWECFDGPRLEIVNAATTPVGGKQIDKCLKNHNQRMVFVPDQLQSLLNEYKEMLIASGEYDPSSKILRGSKTDDYLCADVAGRRIKRLTERLMGKAVSAHGLRHTYASVLNECGVPLDTIRSNLGHTDIRTTMHYVHTYDTSKRESASLISDLLNSN